jgi:hypothetical protein
MVSLQRPLVDKHLDLNVRGLASMALFGPGRTAE